MMPRKVVLHATGNLVGRPASFQSIFLYVLIHVRIIHLTGATACPAPGLLRFEESRLLATQVLLEWSVGKGCQK